MAVKKRKSTTRRKPARKATGHKRVSDATRRKLATAARRRPRRRDGTFK